MDSPPLPQKGARPISDFFRYWAPVIFWMILIFSASADKASYRHSAGLFEPLIRWLFPRLSPITVEQLHHLFRKTCHLGEYAILGWLVWRAVRKPAKPGARPWNWVEAGFALTVVFAYAASDEFHQVFIPNRTALVSDVCIDTVGGAIGLMLLWLRWKLFKFG
jgi:VanZ family protein